MRLAVLALSALTTAFMAGCQGGLTWQPHADAGADLVVVTGDLALLDGSGSSDPDGSIAAWSWTLSDLPEGSQAVLSDNGSAAELRPDQPGIYVLTLRVTDDQGNLSAPDVVSVHAFDPNGRPTADLELKGAIQVGRELVLDGSESSDPEGDSLDYTFSVQSAPEGSTASVVHAGGPEATFTPDLAGHFILGLAVSDGQSTSARVDRSFLATALQNEDPIAVCGGTLTVRAGDEAILDGTASYDPDGDPLTWEWTLEAPEGSGASLDDPSSPTPSLRTDLADTYVGTLVVSDGYAWSEPCTQRVEAVPNTMPVADAGPDLSIALGEAASLDGTASFDADGDPLSYQWSVSTRPTGSVAIPETPLSDTTLIIPDMAGEWEITLRVDDGTDTGADSMLLTVVEDNTTPVAEAGADVSVGVGEVALLDGSASMDPDGDPLTYSWTFVSVPSGSALTDVDIADAASDAPSFETDVEGTYVLQLEVSDGVLSATDTVTVQASDGNSPPVADAGSSQSVDLGDTVLLDGTGSSDPDGDLLTYEWILTAPTGSAAVLDDDTSATPSFVADVAGTYTLTLAVSDGLLMDSDTVTVTASSSSNTAPVADAGANQAVSTGSTVTLDGSDSSDPDGDTLSLAWTLSAPAGSSATLSDPTAVAPTFVADVDGTYTLTLVVSDGSLSDADSMTVVASSGSNTPPVADAGDDVEVDLGDTVTLDGSGSYDADGDALLYYWVFDSVPSDSALTDSAISGNTTTTPSFTPDVDGTYVLWLGITDGSDTAIDSVTVVVIDPTGSNTAPVADAGSDQSGVSTGDTVTLDGSGSSDADGDALTYAWSITSAPSGSSATLTDPDTDAPSFAPDVAGTWVIALTVSDGQDTDSDSVQVSVGSSGNPPVSDAGANQSIALGDTATLDGTASYDPDGDPLTYTWTFVTLPTGSALTDADIIDLDTATPSFTPDVAGIYRIRLWVDDGTSTDRDLTWVTATSSGNTAPVADAGVGQSVSTGATVNLDGTDSSDADGDALTYTWTLSVPTGSSAILDDPSSATPSFIADVAGTYTATLVVSDGALSDSDTTRVTATSSGNTPPVADAGGTMGYDLGEIALLDGSGSYDADGDALSYVWTFSSLPASSTLTDTDIIDATTDLPSFLPDVEGTYVLLLTVSDGTDTDTDTADVVVTDPTSTNTPPVADAGSNQAVDTGDLVTLDGTASSDDDGDPLTYSWTLSTPTGSTAALDDPTSDTPSFTADVDGTYTATLTVSDGVDTDSDSVDVTATTPTTNSPPLADAGPDQNVDVGDTVSLDGTDSSDPDDDPLTWAWTLTAPAGSAAVLDDDTSATPSFTADVEGAYVVQLAVSDGTDLDGDRVVVFATVPNTPPVADAGSDLSVDLGDLITLDGSGSYDDDGDPLTWSWTFDGQPAGSSLTDADISDADTSAPWFTPDAEGSWVLLLTVDDGEDVDIDTVTVTVIGPNDPPVADAGSDQELCQVEDVDVDGSASTDPDGDVLAYAWSFDSLPSDSALDDGDIIGASAPVATFTPDVQGTYVLSLTVDDGEYTDSATTSVVFDTEGVVMALHLDEGTGTSAADATARGNDGVFTGTSGSWTGGPYQGAYSFGGGSMLTVYDSDDLDIADEGTIEWWMSASSPSGASSYELVFYKGGSYNYSMWLTTNTLQGWMLTDSGSYASVSGTASLDGSWHHYALVMDYGLVQLYEDGTLIGSATYSGSLATNSDSLTIGGYSSSTFYNYNGSLDELMIWDTALSATEVADRADDPAQWCTGWEDTDSPDLSIDDPTTGTSVDVPYVAIYGSADDDGTVVSVTVDGYEAISLSGDYDEWVAYVPLVSGRNTVTAVATDLAGNSSTDSIRVDYTDGCGASDAVAHWLLDEDTGSDAEDFSGNTSDATAYSVDWVTGVYGNAARFDGSTSFVQAPRDASFVLTTELTLDLWFRRDGATSDWEILLHKSITSNIGYGVGLYDTGVYFLLTDTSGTSDYVSTLGVTDGDWHHLVAVYDGSAMSLYVDGTLEDSVAFSGTIYDDGTRLYMGSLYGSYYFLDGDLDSVRLYDTALSSSEISALYTEGEPCAVSENLAPSGTATANSTYSSTFSADKVIDESTAEESSTDTTMWLARSATAGAYVTVDLGDMYGLTRVRWANTHNADRYDRATTSYTIEASATGAFAGEEELVETGTISIETTLAYHTIDLTTPVAAQYVRFTVDGYYDQGGGLNELQLFGVE